MGKPLKDITGQKFGRWLVVDRAEKPELSTQTSAYWNCVCDCGTKKVKSGTSLRSKRGLSCGCLKSELNSVRMSDMQKKKYGTIEERFFNRFKKSDNGCWEWASSRDADGYGILPTTGTAIRAHRLSYELHKGEIGTGMVICHSCDNPGCVNPDHLFQGAPAENVIDMLSKGRDKMVGSRNNKAKLTESDIPKIRNSRIPAWEIADDYGVSVSTIKRIKSKKMWRHVK